MKDVFVSLAIILTDQDVREVESYALFLKEHYSDYEILLLTTKPNGPAAALLKKFDKIRLLQLSNALEYELLCAAALENAIGDMVVIGDFANLTTEVIKRGIERCFDGVDILIGCTDVHRPLWYRMGSTIFRTIAASAIGYDLPTNDSGVRIISRRATNAIIAGNKFHRNLFLQMNRSGYPHELLEYKTDRRLRKKLSLYIVYRHAVSLLVMNSTRPLRFANMLGLCASFISFMISCYSVVIYFFKNNVVEGWTTQILFASIQFFFLFLILSFLGEYILRLLSNQNQSSTYSVVSEQHSSVMLDIERLNVMNESISKEVNRSQTGRDR